MSANKEYQPKISTGLDKAMDNCSPTEAQPWCNFVLFTLNTIPPGFSITQQQLRKESKEHVSSFRFVLENIENQRISVKQFLYDWAPPAYDYPSLWLNTKQFAPADFPAPRSLLVDNRVLWIGKNYRGQNAATIDLERTRIEITFDNIELTDETLTSFIQGCKPCDLSLEKEILKTPFSHLSSYFRHNKNAIEVPLSYWKHTRLSTYSRCVVSINERLSNRWISANTEHVINEAGYRLNSIFEIITPTNEIAEKEYLFEHQSCAGVFIQVLVTPNSSAHPIHYPPVIGDQVCKHETLEIKRNKIYLAYLNQPYGNFELIWEQEESVYLMIIQAAPWLTYQWVMDLCENLFVCDSLHL